VKRFLTISLVLGLFLGVIQIFIPLEGLSRSLAPATAKSGRMSGTVLRFPVPKSKQGTVSVEMEIAMDTGVCSVSYIGVQGDEKALLSAGTATPRFTVPAEGYLVLDPGGKSGRYRIHIGPKWHLLSPTPRFAFSVTSTAGLLVLVFLWRSQPYLSLLRQERRKVIYVSSIALLSFFLYSVLHEFGHWIVGYLGGGTASTIVWTPLAGGEPHVSFSHLSQAVVPWMMAGGILIPTVVGLGLVLTWLAFSRRLQWPLSYAMIIPGVLFLFSNVACVVPSDRHMSFLTAKFGLEGFGASLVAAIPLVLTIAAYGCVVMRLMSRGREVQQNAAPNDGPAAPIDNSDGLRGGRHR